MNSRTNAFHSGAECEMGTRVDFSVRVVSDCIGVSNKG